MSPSSAPPTRPAAIAWYRAFAVASGLIYAFLAAAFAIVSGGIAGRADHELVPLALLCALPVVAFYGVAVMVPYRPWGWTYALVAITLGLPSILAPGAIALIVFWLRPDVKIAFGRA